jgi:hypothetical protein
MKAILISLYERRESLGEEGIQSLSHNILNLFDTNISKSTSDILPTRTPNFSGLSAPFLVLYRTFHYNCFQRNNQSFVALSIIAELKLKIVRLSPERGIRRTAFLFRGAP